jgi:hypothetical protein
MRYPEQQRRAVNCACTGAERELHWHLDRGRPDSSDRQERQPGGARNGHVGHPLGVTSLVGKTILMRPTKWIEARTCEIAAPIALPLGCPWII